jgi:pilus assembly protein CpaB
LIQDAVVLQMGDFASEDAPEPVAETDIQDPQQAQNQQTAQEEEAPVPAGPNVVTLVVSPQDAVTLNYLMLAGAQLNMVLRSAGDDQRVDTEAVTLQFIMDQHRIPNPAKLPYGLEPRLDNFPGTVPPFPDAAPRPTATPAAE